MENINVLNAINTAFLISAFAFMRVPLRYAGFCIEEGVVLVVQDIAMFDRVVGELCGFNAVKCRLRLNGVINALNYQLVVANYDRCYKEEVIKSFMSETGFLPALLVKGMAPRELRSFKNVFLIGELDTNPELWKFRKGLFEEFTLYITNDSTDILGEFERLRIANERERRQWFSDVPAALGAVTGVIYEYVRKKYGLANSTNSYDMLMNLNKCVLSSYYRDDIELDIMDAVCRCLARYLDTHSEILIGAVDQPEFEFWLACEEGRTIVYDTDAYYMNDKILKDATEKSLGFMPYLRIKQDLKNYGALVCNVGGSDGFTVKKVFWKPDGSTIRPRVLKLSRERLDGVIHPDIFQRRYAACTSVSTRIEP